jgi:hypothetical protein
MSKTETKISEMEEIMTTYGNMIEGIENTQNWMLYDCKYKNNGIEFNFRSNVGKYHIRMFIENTE